MTPVEAARQLQVHVTELWRSVLCDLWRAPGERLNGTVQFEIVGAEGPRFFSVALLDGQVSSTLGIAADATAWIETTDAAVVAMLEGAAPADKLVVSGDTAFVTRLFESLRSRSATMSLLGARLSR